MTTKILYVNLLSLAVRDNDKISELFIGKVEEDVYNVGPLTLIGKEHVDHIINEINRRSPDVVAFLTVRGDVKESIWVKFGMTIKPKVAIIYKAAMVNSVEMVEKGGE